jgi:hypothetical protein
VIALPASMPPDGFDLQRGFTLPGEEIAWRGDRNRSSLFALSLCRTENYVGRKTGIHPRSSRGQAAPESALVVTIGMARATCAHFRQAISADFVVDLIRFAKPDTVRKPVRKPQPRSRHAEENQSGRGIISGSGQLHAIRRIGAVLVAFAHERPDRF